MSLINTVFRALIFTAIIVALLYSFKNKSKTSISDNIATIFPKDTVKNAPPIVVDYILKNIPFEKQSKIASISAELASASANWKPYKEEKVKELKLMLLDEIYKNALESIKK